VTPPKVWKCAAESGQAVLPESLVLGAYYRQTCIVICQGKKERDREIFIYNVAESCRGLSGKSVAGISLYRRVPPSQRAADCLGDGCRRWQRRELPPKAGFSSCSTNGTAGPAFEHKR